MANLGSLVVSLEANIAKFTSDMRQASQQTEQSMQKMGAAVDKVKEGLAALGVGLSVGALAELVKSSIDAADHLRDMSQKTGIAIETLNGLQFAAGQAGGSLDLVVDAAKEVNKSVVEAAGGNKDIAEAYNKLGINVRDAAGHYKTADVIMTEVAEKFAGYADGAAKTAIAVRIFGESGAALIPLLNDGGVALQQNIAYAQAYSGVTAEMANASDNFNDTMGKLTVQQKSFGNAVAGQVLPLLQKVADELLHSAENADKFSFASNAIRLVLETFIVTGSEVAFVFKTVGTEIGGIAAQLVALAHGDFDGFHVISDAMKKDAEKARKEHDAFIESILAPPPPAAPKDDTATPAKPQAPKIRAQGDDPTKSLMEGRLRAIETANAAERSTASYHDKYMQELRAQDLVDLQTYEAYKMASIDTTLANAKRAYDAELAILRTARGAAAKEADRADIDNKIKDIAAKKEKAIQDAQQARAIATLSLASAQSELNKSTKEWVILQGQSEEQFQFEISLYGKSAVEAAKLTAARRIYLDVEERIRQAQKNSAVPIDRSAFDTERDKAIAASNALYDQANAKQQDPWFNMTESIRLYGEEASNTGAAIGSALTNSFKTAEDAFLQFTQTGKISFKSMAASIIADFARIEARKGMSTLLSLGMGALTSYFGSSVASAGSFDFQPTNLDTSTPFLDGIAVAGARATGGAVLGNSAYLVGERGPEIFRPTGAGSITPNNQIGGGGGDITINMELNVSDSGTSGQASGDSDKQARALGELITSKVKETISNERRQGGMLWQMQQGR